MRMPRLTLKFLVKSFILVMIIMFILPYALHHLESQEDENSRELSKKSVKKDLEKQQKYDFVPDQPFENVHKPVEAPKGQEMQGGVQVANPAGVNNEPAVYVHNVPQKVYGPKAEFKDGVKGNYEPDIPITSGPGEQGQPVMVSMDEKAAADISIREYGFNMVASDKISMTRTIPDTRMAECQYWQYPEKLPTASVIIVFHNEGWSTLLRTVHSIIHMSPPQLLHEVVMVDDFSNKANLKEPLEEYIQKEFHGKVKLFRNEKRLGLIRTRTLGARYSTGDVIVFLDAHCECNKNWLPPLLARIAYDRTIMAVPIVDGVEWNNFRYASVYGAPENHHRGIFEWGFLYKESSVPQKELQKRPHNSEPYWSPTHAGGLFAMDRKYFQELGEYDEGLLIWGGENFELSFKIWQCGGSIEWVPCSRVGHVYRNHMPYGFGDINPKIPVISMNYMRVVEVWLDDKFKEYFYTREPSIRGYPVGDLTKQLEFKQKHCNLSFEWFMDNVAYEVYEKFPPPPPNVGWGEVSMVADPLWCMDSSQMHPPATATLRHCHKYGGTQFFRLNTQGQLAVGERCLDSRGSEIHVVYCNVEPSGPWQWDQDTQHIKHTSRGLCAEGQPEHSKLLLANCDVDQKNQKWTITPIWTWK